MSAPAKKSFDEHDRAEVEQSARLAIRQLESLVGCAVTFAADHEAGQPCEAELRRYYARVAKLSGAIRGDLEAIRALAGTAKRFQRGPNAGEFATDEEARRWLLSEQANGRRVPS